MEKSSERIDFWEKDRYNYNVHILIFIFVPNKRTFSIMGNGKSPKTKSTLFVLELSNIMA